MENQHCQGLVYTLSKHTVLITGKVYIRGDHVDRRALFKRIRAAGGQQAPGDSKWVTLLVIGDLDSGRVVDPVNLRSQKLIDVEARRREGSHVCIVDEFGLGELFDGRPASCLKTRGGTARTVEVSVIAKLQVLGGPVEARSVGERDSSVLALDLSALDRGSAAHELLVSDLKIHLRERGITARGAGEGMPWFDIGWEDGEVLFIAELKSLTGTDQAQQIRLGIGQVLDYVNDARVQLGKGNHSVAAALVVQHEPSDPRWQNLCDALRIRLTWAPDFPGLVERT